MAWGPVRRLGVLPIPGGAFRRGLAPALLAVLLCAAAGSARARVFLTPGGAAPTGELGFLMGGALTALASGGEAVWINPAGVVRDPESRLAASADVLTVQQVTLGSSRVSTTSGGHPAVALSRPIGQRRTLPWFAYALALRTSPSHRFDARFIDARTGTASALPPALRTGLNIDTDFPGGFDIAETSEGLGELEVFSPAVALAFSPGGGFRVGVAMRLEHVLLSERALIRRVYSGSEGANTLSGHATDTLVLEGRANRLTSSLGLQLELAGGVVLGAAVDFPSQTLAGSGRVQLERRQSLTVDLGGPVTQNDAAYFSGGEGLPFRLESPMVLRLGVALVSDWFLAELDVALTREQAPYQVLPAVSGQPPSTGAVQSGPWTTSGSAASRWALGMAFTQSERGSLVLGLAVEDSPVPEDDPLLTPVDANTVSLGYYHAEGRFSGSAGLALTLGEPRAQALKDTSTEETVRRQVQWEQAVVHLGGTVTF